MSEHGVDRMPSIEANYNPSLFMLMAEDPRYFQSQLTPVVRSVANWQGVDTSPEFGAMRAVMNRLVTETPSILGAQIFGDFATRQKWTKEVDYFGQTRVTTQDFTDLSEEQRLEWDSYRLTGKVPREVALVAFERSILFFISTLPSVRYASDPGVRKLDEELRGVGFQLAVKLFPDLTDDEARKLFGVLTSAEDVRKRAQGMAPNAPVTIS